MLKLYKINKCKFFAFCIFIFLINCPLSKGKIDLEDKACLYVLNPLLNLDSIKVTTETWIKGKDSCVIALIDSLTDRYINTNDRKALSCIESVCNLAEGYIGDILVESTGMIFYSCLADFAKYIYYYKENYGEDHCLIKYLVFALSMEVYDSKNKQKEISEIGKFIDTQCKNNNLSKEIIEYLQEIKSKINPNIWE